MLKVTLWLADADATQKGVHGGVSSARTLPASTSKVTKERGLLIADWSAHYYHFQANFVFLVLTSLNIDKIDRRQQIGNNQANDEQRKPEAGPFSRVTAAGSPRRVNVDTPSST